MCTDPVDPSTSEAALEPLALRLVLSRGDDLLAGLEVVRHCIIQPPSTSRLTPFIAVFSSKNTDASTISRVMHVAPGRRAGAHVREVLLLAAPERRVGHDAGMDRVDAYGRELDGQRPDEGRDGAVHRRDRRRAGVRPVLRQPAEEEDRRVRRQPAGELVDDLGVADELQGRRGESRRRCRTRPRCSDRDPPRRERACRRAPCREGRRRSSEARQGRRRYLAPRRRARRRRQPPSPRPVR